MCKSSVVIDRVPYEGPEVQSGRTQGNRMPMLSLICGIVEDGLGGMAKHHLQITMHKPYKHIEIFFFLNEQNIKNIYTCIYITHSN